MALSGDTMSQTNKEEIDDFSILNSTMLQNNNLLMLLEYIK